MTTKKYFQLNLGQRYQLSALLKAGHASSFIAQQLGVHRSTISRELKRNSNSYKRYKPVLAQQFANDRQNDKHHHGCFSDEMKSFIQNKMQQEQWSPEQIKGYCKANGISMVSHEWIYQYVYQNMKQGGTLFKHLRTQHKRRRKRTHRKDRRGLIPNRISIHQRPKYVDEKLRFGDWEVDLIEGNNHNSFAVTLVERKSQFALIIKSPDKQADTIQTKIINALAPYKELVHTITSDNGKEFAGHQYIAQKLNANYYFADPYSSWQRGLNEYTNKLFRQYFPKKSNLNHFETKYFVDIANKLNTRPRKLLNFKSPLQVFLNNFKPN